MGRIIGIMTVRSRGVVDLLVIRAVNGGGEESFGLRIFEIAYCVLVVRALYLKLGWRVNSLYRNHFILRRDYLRVMFRR